MSASEITKRAIAQSFKQLLESQDPESITVSAICSACGVNRKTFYYHFRDKYELVEWIYDTELADELRSISATTALDRWGLFCAVCAYLDRNRPFYRKTMQHGGQNSFTDYARSLATAMLERQLAGLLPESSPHYDRALSFIVTFYADAFVASIRRWILSDDPLPLEDYLKLLRISLFTIPRKSSEQSVQIDIDECIRIMESIES